MSALFLIVLVGMSSFWLTFEASQASISLQISYIVTHLKENQLEGFLWLQLDSNPERLSS